MSADAPVICTVCFWSIEPWHAPVKREGTVVHAVCLGDNESGFERKPGARAEPRNHTSRTGELRAM